MDDAGDTAPAAAMAMLIVYTSAGVRLLHAGLSRWLLLAGLLAVLLGLGPVSYTHLDVYKRQAGDCVHHAGSCLSFW